MIDADRPWSCSTRVLRSKSALGAIALSGFTIGITACTSGTGAPPRTRAGGQPGPSSVRVSVGAESDATRPEPTSAPPQPQAVEVVHVNDGDTVLIQLPGAREKVRFIGINTPDDSECLYDDATNELKRLIGSGPITITPDGSDRDRYGRLLRYVDVDGVDAGKWLLQQGLAIIFPIGDNVSRADIYASAEDDARVSKRGVWASDACGPASPAQLTISGFRANPDGADDNNNLNEEWVQITNDGESPVSLKGWAIRDRSTSHRYHFADRFSLEAHQTVTLRTGVGVDTASDLYWNKTESAVWNNNGDAAMLLDPNGNIHAFRQYP